MTTSPPGVHDQFGRKGELISAVAPDHPRGSMRPRSLLLPITASALLVYFVLVGATPAGELLASARAMNTVIGGLLVMAYVAVVPRQADRVDAWAVVALMCFVAAAIGSELPRQSLDAVLAMVGYVAAFSLLRVALMDPLVRRATLLSVMALAAFTAVLAFTRLLNSVVEWWLATGIAPPLGLAFSSAPWGHFYDFVLLAAMLAPAWLAGRLTRPKLVIVSLIGFMVGIVALLQGARAVWLALFLATVVAFGPRLLKQARGARLDRRLVLAGLGIGALVAVAIGGPIATRLFTSATLGQRWDMWGALVEVWAQRPLTGLGPGTFPWALQTTSYFDTSVIAPRHPDSAVFQLLAEAGVLGVAGVAALCAGVGIPLLRSGMTPAIWAVAAFLFAGLAMNPTDFGYFVVVAMWWVALALGKQRPAEARGGAEWRRRRLSGGVLAAMVILLAIPVGMAVLAGARYERARELASAGNVRGALLELDAAVTLDPSMALYLRQRGSAHLLTGDLEAATRDFAQAVELNPLDDLAWRALALAHREAGAVGEADRAIERAIGIQRSDPTNLLLKIEWSNEDGSGSEARELLAEVVLAWPAVTGAPGWPEMLPADDTTLDIVDRALNRWRQELPSVEPITTQALWLAAMADRPELIDEAAAEGGYSEQLASAFVAVAGCDPSADSALDMVAEADRRTTTYWLLEDRNAALLGSGDEEIDRILYLFLIPTFDDDRADATLSPLRVNDVRGYRPDEWGYRRPSIAWESPGPVLPDPRSGELMWTGDPVRASMIAGIPESCQRSPEP